MSAPQIGTFNVRLAIQESAPKELADKRGRREELVAELRKLSTEIAELEVWTLIGGGEA